MTDGLDEQGGGQGPQPRAQGYPFGPGDPVTPDADAPRGNRFNYQPTPRRPHTEWGEPDDHLRFAQSYGAVVPGPWWPQPDQIPRLLGQGPTSLNNLMQISSGTGQRNSLATMTYLAAYLKAKQAAQDEEPRRESEALRLSLEKQTAELNAEVRDYADVLARKNLNPEQRHQAMTKIAYKYNDNNLIQTINAGDWAGAEEMLKEREARSQDYQKMIQTMDAHRRSEDEHRAAEDKANNAEETQRNQEAPFKQAPSSYTPPPLPSLDAGEAPGASAAGKPPAADQPAQPAVPGEAGAGAPATGGAAAPAAAPAAGDNEGGIGIPGVTQATPEMDAPRTDVAAGAPMQYPPTAMAGDTMSDAPPIGMSAGTQTAQAGRAPAGGAAPAGAPNTMPQFNAENSPTLKNAASQAGYVNGPLLDQLAQGIVMGTTKESEVKAMNPRALPYVMARAQEIKQKLDALSNPNNPVTPQQTLDEVRKVLPAFAGQLLATVKGDAPAPTPSSRNPMAPYIMALGKKIDDSFDENQYRVRYGVLKSATSGKISDNLKNLMTTEDHIELMRDLARKLPHLGGLNPLGNALLQKMIAGGLSDWDLNIASALFGVDAREMQTNIRAYQTLAHQVAPEVARMQMGGNKPGKEEIASAEKSFELGTPPATLEYQFRNIQSLTWHRVQETANGTAGALNRWKKDANGNFIRNSVGQRIPDGNTVLEPFGRVLENPNYRYEDGSAPLPNEPGRDLQGKLKHFINDPPPPGPTAAPPAKSATPASIGAGALKGTGYSFEP